MKSELIFCSVWQILGFHGKHFGLLCVIDISDYGNFLNQHVVLKERSLTLMTINHYILV
jgi:hypothetical protein